MIFLQTNSWSEQFVVKEFISKVGGSIKLTENWTIKQDTGENWTLQQSDGHIALNIYTFKKEEKELSELQKKALKSYEELNFSFKDSKWENCSHDTFKGSFIEGIDLKNKKERWMLFVAQGKKADNYILVKLSKLSYKLNKKIIIKFIQTYKSP